MQACPNCNELIADNFDKCPLCQHTIRGVNDRQRVNPGATKSAAGASPRTCPHCYGEIDARASACPHCGRATKTASGAFRAGTLVMALGLLVLIGGVFVDWTVLVLGLALMGVGAAVRLGAK